MPRGPRPNARRWSFQRPRTEPPGTGNALAAPTRGAPSSGSPPPLPVQPGIWGVIPPGIHLTDAGGLVCPPPPPQRFRVKGLESRVPKRRVWAGITREVRPATRPLTPHQESACDRSACWEPWRDAFRKGLAGGLEALRLAVGRAQGPGRGCLWAAFNNGRQVRPRTVSATSYSRPESIWSGLPARAPESARAGAADQAACSRTLIRSSLAAVTTSSRTSLVSPSFSYFRTLKNPVRATRSLLR